LATTFFELRLEGIEKDLPRGSRSSNGREQIEKEIIRKTTQEKPQNANYWGTRTLAAELDVSQTMVHRVWQANGVDCHSRRIDNAKRHKRDAENLCVTENEWETCVSNCQTAMFAIDETIKMYRDIDRCVACDAYETSYAQNTANYDLYYASGTALSPTGTQR
jgi:hypothetical protein